MEIHVLISFSLSPRLVIRGMPLWLRGKEELVSLVSSVTHLIQGEGKLHKEGGR